MAFYEHGNLQNALITRPIGAFFIFEVKVNSLERFEHLIEKITCRIDF